MEWTGIMGYTKDEQPIIGQAPGQDGLWICAGFHGHGKSDVYIQCACYERLISCSLHRHGTYFPSCGSACGVVGGKGGRSWEMVA